MIFLGSGSNIIQSFTAMHDYNSNVSLVVNKFVMTVDLFITFLINNNNQYSS